jgi:D-cysteine desulfhydrase family pyridoxal phosphate-dependent enzyme
MLSLPRVRLAQLPTPVEALPRLSDYLGGPRLSVKRDDQTGLVFGGNKTRKLELLVADAQLKNARTLITAGAVQSNHCRQTAAAAARYGFDCILVLAGETPHEYTGNLFLDYLLGSELVWTSREKREQVLRETFNQAVNSGRNPYLIPYGGSNPVGAAAYALAIKEMIDQHEQPDWIVFASSSGGTQAGMTVGSRLFDYGGHILGISIDETSHTLSRRVAQLATDTAEKLGEKIKFSEDDVEVVDDYLGDGYGVMGSGEREAIELFARYEGLLLDPVYTGRAAAGMIDLIRKDLFPKESRVLFWHTGGAPALFASQYQVELQRK